MLWFRETLVGFPVSYADGEDGMSVMDSRARRGDSPPYHVHHTHDECFHVLEGELVLLVGGRARRLTAGETLLAPKGIPHTYRVVSEQARWLGVTTGPDFEDFVRSLSQPAPAAELPPPPGAPTPEEEQALAEAALAHGIEILGPPLDQDVAEAA
jgi:quercetin dioxygenase-like cupin family protein